MSDFNSSLPVRTQNPGDVSAIMVDATTPSQGAKVDTHGSQYMVIANASGTATTSQVNGSQQALDVGINVSGVQIDPRLGGQYLSSLPTLSSGAFTALMTNINGILLTSPESDAAPATQSITAQDTVSTTTSGANGQGFITGSPTAGSTASFTLASQETVELQITGTWTGTLSTEVSIDGGTTWFTRGVKQTGSSYLGSSYTANFEGVMNSAAVTTVRVRSTATWTGTATVKMVSSLNPASLVISNPLTLRDATTQSITNTIKAASTAAVATDTSLVVALSPNSPIPAGTNLIGSVNQGTSPWITKDQADGPVAPGTVASFSQLMGGQYSSALPTLTNGQQSAIQVDANGRAWANVTNLPTTVDTNYGTIGASSLRIAAQLGNATGALDYNNGATDAQTLRTAANLAVAGANVSSTNPVPVYLTSASPGTVVNSYMSSVNLAAGASVNLTYTIPAGKTFSAYKFWSSGSGKIRVDVQSSPDGSTYSTYWTGFNSTAQPNVDINLTEPAEFQDSGTGSTIRIVITNRDLTAFDVFATITGTYQ
jgi:hypothetical protein